MAADGKDASKNSPGQVIVNIAWVPINDVGSIEISDIKYPDADSIIPPIQKAIQANPVARVLIRADRSVKWEFMKTVMRKMSLCKKYSDNSPMYKTAFLGIPMSTNAEVEPLRVMMSPALTVVPSTEKVRAL